MSVHKLGDYKISKTVVRDLEAILTVINLTIRGLQLFKHYIPVAKVLNVLENEKGILNAHLQKYTKINQEKGKVE